MKVGLLAVMIGLVMSAPKVSAQTDSARSSRPRASTPKAETYEAVSIDAGGNLQITTTDHRTIVVPKDAKQTTITEPFISQDRTVVGATGFFTLADVYVDTVESSV